MGRTQSETRKKAGRYRWALGGLVLNRQRRRERQAVTAQKPINDLHATAPQHAIGESPLKSAHDILGGQSVRRTPDSFGSACWRLGGLASGLALVIGEVGELAHRSAVRLQPVHGCCLALLSDREAADHGVILRDLERDDVQAVRRRRIGGAGDKGRGRQERFLLSPVEI